MQRKIWNQIRKEFSIWRVGAFPGLLIIAFVVAARLTGSLQFLELITLDTLMRLRPPEPVDERIVLVGINEKDIQRLKDYPVTDEKIALLINKIQAYNPKVIGLDIIRDKPVNPGNSKLQKLLKENSNIIGIEKILPPHPISAQEQLPQERIGFSDVISDIDGKTRRILLGTNTSQGFKFSFSLRLAEAYLAPNISLENGKRDEKTMRFNRTELPRFQSNVGGYVKENDSGLKTLLNFRSGTNTFKLLSFQDIISEDFSPKLRNLINNNIVIIGITAESVPDFINTSAVPGTHRGRIYGIEFHGHAASQILSSVIDNRPLLKTLRDRWEYIWIICWGLIAISLGRKFDFSLFKSIFAVITAGSILIGIGYTCGSCVLSVLKC
jgi:CHASE2 domain-containing sensor protein